MFKKFVSALFFLFSLWISFDSKAYLAITCAKA